MHSFIENKRALTSWASGSVIRLVTSGEISSFAISSTVVSGDAEASTSTVAVTEARGESVKTACSAEEAARWNGGAKSSLSVVEVQTSYMCEHKRSSSTDKPDLTSLDPGSDDGSTSFRGSFATSSTIVVTWEVELVTSSAPLVIGADNESLGVACSNATSEKEAESNSGVAGAEISCTK